MVEAQSDSSGFTISVFGGEDVVKPTTPVLQSVDPVTSSQINVEWTASTDNFAVGGYVVARDGLPIATTTQLQYADTGLSAGTTYSYYVTAFDNAGNYSSSSNSIATTTPDVFVPPPPATTTDDARTQGTAVRTVTEDFSITTGPTTAVINVLLARPAALQLRWGRTSSYELGYVMRETVVRAHEIPLSDLTPGTTYEYELIGYSPRGVETVLRRGEFTTAGEREQYLPANVANFTAERFEETSVRLSWSIPAEELGNLQYVRIVRNHYGFPAHPSDGATIYQGTGSRVNDPGILATHSPIYYTAFLVDQSGQVSSGAVAFATADRTGVSPAPSGEQSSPDPTEPTAPTLPGTGVSGPVTEATSSIATSTTGDMPLRLPELTDITLTQGNDIFTLLDREITLIAQQAVVISIPADRVSSQLKTVIVTIVDPTDTRKRLSYLLRINQDRSAYEATIPAVGVLGRSEVMLQIYDFGSEVVSTYRAPVRFVTDGQEIVVFPDQVYSTAPRLAIALGLAAVLLWLFFFWRRRLQNEDNVTS